VIGGKAMYRNPQMKVEFKASRVSGIYLDPVCKRRLKQYQRMIIEEHRQGSPNMHNEWNKEYTEKWLRNGPCILIEPDYLAMEALQDARFTTAEKNHLEHGYTVVKLIDIETFEHWFANYNQIDLGM
jgi:hypothetical protein